MTTIERRAKLLSGKDWQALRSFWLRHIPDIDRPAQEPTDTLAQSVDLERESSVAPKTGDHRFQVSVNPASLLFRESVFVLCKAVRVSCESGSQVVAGLPTWSVSTAYHSSLFALRAFLGFCGIGYIILDNGHFLVDVEPSQPKGKRQRKIRQVTDDTEIQLIRVPQIGHREWWLLYQRILRSSKGFNWSFPIDRQSLLCDESIFSKHRNELHYRLRWFYDDLLETKLVSGFGEFDQEAAETVVAKLSEAGGSDGALILNQIVLGNVLSMLIDLSGVSKRVRIVVKEIKTAVDALKNDVVESWFARLLV